VVRHRLSIRARTNLMKALKGHSAGDPMSR
jgi:hypothetical protein